MNRDISTSCSFRFYLWLEFKRILRNSYLLILIYALLGILLQWTNDNLVLIKFFPGGTMIDGIRQFAYGMLTLPIILGPVCYGCYSHRLSENNFSCFETPLKKTTSVFINIFLMIGLYVGVYTLLDYLIILLQPTHIGLWEEFERLSGRHFFLNISTSALCVAYGSVLGTIVSKSHKFVILFLHSICFGLMSVMLYMLMCQFCSALFDKLFFQFIQIITLLLMLSALFFMIYYVHKNITASNQES